MAEQQEELQQQQRREITEEDRQRFESYVGQEWAGTVKWYNVKKRFGFIIPHHAESKSHGYDLFSPKREIRRNDNRSHADESLVKFRVGIGKKGLEARHITNLEGGEPEGRQITCYKCGMLGTHTAKKCKNPRVCYGCRSTEHLQRDCQTTK